MYDNFDNPNENENDDQSMEKALAKYQDMVVSGIPQFLDSEEYEMVVDYYIAENSLKKAEDAINNALTQYPNQKVPFQLRRAICYASSNQEQKALDILSEIETIEPENADIMLTKGAIYSQLQRYEKAIEEYKKALKDYDELDEVYYSIAQEYQNLGQTDKAISYLKKSLLANSDNEAAIFELSMVYELAGKSDEAVEFFTLFSDENPMIHLSWFCLAMAYSNIGLYEKAILAFDYCLVLDENFLSAYLNKSNAHIELEQYTEAIDTYKEALAIDSENSYILYCMGECYLDMNDLEKAEKHFLDSIMMSDLLSDAWIGLSSVYEEQSKFDRAINCIKKAIEIDNDNVDYIQYLARIYHLTDDTENAIKSYREALRLLPESIDTWIDLAELYYTDLENSDEAIAILKESITTLGRIDYEVITRMSTYLFLTGAIESAELLLLTIDDESFDYTGKMILYESTLINNPTFWAMIERVKPNEKI